MDILSDEEGEDGVVTAQQVLEAMEAAWLNERCSPELLPHRSDLVDCLLDQIHHMEANLERLHRAAHTAPASHGLRLALHRMELERIRYVVASYLRARLAKIHEYSAHVLREDVRRRPAPPYLSTSEEAFARQYVANADALMATLALRHMPPNVHRGGSGVDDDPCGITAVAPNLDAHVFLRANRNVTAVLGVAGAGDEDEDVDVELETGSQHIIPYSCVCQLVKEGAVQLI